MLPAVAIFLAPMKLPSIALLLLLLLLPLVCSVPNTMNLTAAPMT
jgi:hypothetical protein